MQKSVKYYKTAKNHQCIRLKKKHKKPQNNNQKKPPNKYCSIVPRLEERPLPPHPPFFLYKKKKKKLHNIYNFKSHKNVKQTKIIQCSQALKYGFIRSALPGLAYSQNRHLLLVFVFGSLSFLLEWRKIDLTEWATSS